MVFFEKNIVFSFGPRMGFNIAANDITFTNNQNTHNRINMQYNDAVGVS
jgi:hypothetical protein